MKSELLNSGNSELITAWNEFKKILPEYIPADFQISLEKYIQAAGKKFNLSLPNLEKILKKSPEARIEVCGALPVLCYQKGAFDV